MLYTCLWRSLNIFNTVREKALLRGQCRVIYSAFLFCFPFYHILNQRAMQLPTAPTSPRSHEHINKRAKMKAWWQQRQGLLNILEILFPPLTWSRLISWRLWREADLHKWARLPYGCGVRDITLQLEGGTTPAFSRKQNEISRAQQAENSSVPLWQRQTAEWAGCAREWITPWASASIKMRLISGQAGGWSVTEAG